MGSIELAYRWRFLVVAQRTIRNLVSSKNLWGSLGIIWRTFARPMKNVKGHIATFGGSTSDLYMTHEGHQKISKWLSLKLFRFGLSFSIQIYSWFIFWQQRLLKWLPFYYLFLHESLESRKTLNSIKFWNCVCYNYKNIENLKRIKTKVKEFEN